MNKAKNLSRVSQTVREMTPKWHSNAIQRQYLCGSTCRVDKANSLRANIGSFQGSDEELIVSLVDGVATLEGQHVGALWQSGADLCWGSTGEDPLGQLQTLHLAT